MGVGPEPVCGSGGAGTTALGLGWEEEAFGCGGVYGGGGIASLLVSIAMMVKEARL